MDRDTIIDGLRMTMDLFTFDPTTGEEKDPDDLNDLDRATYDACKGALEILERLGANLAEVGTDCISRQAAIDALDEQIEQCDKSLSSFDISIKDEFAVKVERASLVTFRETLEYLPTAEPQRIKGKWALQSDDYHEYYECDQCGMAVGLDDVRNFCPNCGADMREVTT